MTYTFSNKGIDTSTGVLQISTRSTRPLQLLEYSLVQLGEQGPCIKALALLVLLNPSRKIEIRVSDIINYVEMGSNICVAKCILSYRNSGRMKLGVEE